MAIPQLIIFLDPNGALCAEGPGKNGMRQKIALEPGRELLTLRAELLAQRDAQEAEAAHRRAIDEREDHARAERLFARTWQRHRDLALAEKVVPALKGKYSDSFTMAQVLSEADLDI